METSLQTDVAVCESVCATARRTSTIIHDYPQKYKQYRGHMAL